MKTIVLCGRQNISIRGHRDNLSDLEKDFSSSDSHSNFLVHLNFRIEAGDTILGEHLSTAVRNATYISNTIQNQIIDVLADQLIRQNIIQKVQAAKWYTVITPARKRAAGGNFHLKVGGGAKSSGNAGDLMLGVAVNL